MTDDDQGDRRSGDVFDGRGDEVEHAEVEVITLAIENGGASLVFCSKCDELVGVDDQGLDCGHGRSYAPILDDERFDDVFESPGVIGRLRRRVASAFE